MKCYSVVKGTVIKNSVIVRSLNLEPVIQSEVSQKNKYHILIYIYIYGI